MVPTLVTRTARDQILALADDGREAVDAAIENLGEETGEPIDLPAAPEGTTYLAMKTSGDDTPVVIYRAVPEGEGGGWLVLSLMSPEEYKDVLELQKLLAEAPAAREMVEAVLAGVSAETSHGGPRPSGLSADVSREQILIPVDPRHGPPVLPRLPPRRDDPPAVKIRDAETREAEDEAHRRK